jgi:quercetin dioxygenase-like cupin family protein
MQLFSQAGSGTAVETGPGTTRRLLLHTPELMLVEFNFQAGAVGALHSHPHVQASYVAAGRFEVTIAGETATLRAGESFIVPPNAEHGVVALEPGTLIDSFTPARADFL